MLGKTRSQERGVRSDKQHHESEGESRHARLRAPPSWEKVAIGGNTRSDANKGQRIEARLLQPRTLRFGFLQDRNVGVGIFPEGEEILVCTLRLGGIACHRGGATELKMRQCTDGFVEHKPAMV